MRFSAVFILIFGAACLAHAEGDLTRLAYFPTKGVVEIEPSLKTTLHDVLTGSNGTSTTAAANQYYLNLHDGLAPRLRVGLQESLLWDQAKTSSGALANSSTGLSDPDFNVAWRYWMNEGDGFAGDVQLDITPSMGPSISADGNVSQLGNNLNGHWVAQYSASLFRRDDWNEIEALIQASDNLAGRTNGPNALQSLNSDPYWSESLALYDRVHFGAKHFFEIGGVYNLPYAVAFEMDSGGHGTREIPTYLNPSAVFGYSPDPDIVIELAAVYHRATTTKTIWTKQGLLSSSAENTETSTYASIRLLHQF